MRRIKLIFSLAVTMAAMLVVFSSQATADDDFDRCRETDREFFGEDVIVCRDDGDREFFVEDEVEFFDVNDDIDFEDGDLDFVAVDDHFDFVNDDALFFLGLPFFFGTDHLVVEEVEFEDGRLEEVEFI